MVPIKAIDSERMRGNFSSHASHYDSYASVQKRVVEILCDKLSGYTSQTGPLLDIGTGTGALASAILNRRPGQQLVVIDIAHGMTKRAVQRLPRVKACDGDARSLPFDNGSFAGVVSSSVYQWIVDLPSAFGEVVRVLEPGGFFALALFGEQTLSELRSSHCRAVEECNRGRDSHVQNFPCLAEVVDAIESANLDCHSAFSTMEVEFHESVPALLRQLKQIGASNASADRPRGLASRQVMQAMMRFYEEGYRCPEGLPASYEVIVVLAQKRA